MTRDTFQSDVTQLPMSLSFEKRTRKYSEPPKTDQRNPQEIVKPIHETDGAVPRGSLSAHHKLVLSCLAACGGQRGIVQLSRDVTEQMEGWDSKSPSALQEVYLAVHSIVDDLAERGIVTYADNAGTIRVS